MTDDTLADAEIAALMLRHPKGFDLSLDRIERLLDALGNPQDRLPPVIHVGRRARPVRRRPAGPACLRLN